jgi:hypothetical protein
MWLRGILVDQETSISSLNFLKRNCQAFGTIEREIIDGPLTNVNQNDM